MKNFIRLSFILVILSGCKNEVIESWSLVPYPNTISMDKGVFSFDNSIVFSTHESSLSQTITFFKNKFKTLGINTANNSERKIKLELKKLDNANPEAYNITINRNEIHITASDPKGVFYALMTLWQELAFSQRKTVPCGQIKDEPRFEYRGFMLDESRHFFGKKKVKQILDLMAIFKLNTFHWHLTDTPGWRIEIKALPRLTTIGGKGNLTDPNGELAYYTQEEIREIVAYAKERNIEIIPEIDMPGHASAANRAYPEFSGGGSERHPDFTFDVGKEATYEYLNSILKEVADLFPSKYIHLGGDEVHFGNEKWHTNDSIQTLMNQENLNTLVDVEHYFIERMEDHLSELNKNLAGWDEIVESEVNNEQVLVYWWRHDKIEQLNKALAKEFQTVLCPRIPYYLDFVQHEKDSVGRRWDGNFGTLEDAYHYPDSTHAFSGKEIQFIKGLQANLWSETVQSAKRIDYLTFPRLVAMSEAAWTKKNNKNLTRFTENLAEIYKFLDDTNIYYFDVHNPDARKEPAK